MRMRSVERGMRNVDFPRMSPTADTHLRRPWQLSRRLAAKRDLSLGKGCAAFLTAGGPNLVAPPSGA